MNGSPITGREQVPSQSTDEYGMPYLHGEKKLLDGWMDGCLDGYLRFTVCVREGGVPIGRRDDPPHPAGKGGVLVSERKHQQLLQQVYIWVAEQRLHVIPPLAFLESFDYSHLLPINYSCYISLYVHSSSCLTGANRATITSNPSTKLTTMEDGAQLVS